MAKRINLSAANAVRTILKNKEDFKVELVDKSEDGERTNYQFDVFFNDQNGTFKIATEGDEIKVAVLNLNMGRIISLATDTNIKKLAQHVLDNEL